MPLFLLTSDPLCEVKQLEDANAELLALDAIRAEELQELRLAVDEISAKLRRGKGASGGIRSQMERTPRLNLLSALKSLEWRLSFRGLDRCTAMGTLHLISKFEKTQRLCSALIARLELLLCHRLSPSI